MKQLFLTFFLPLFLFSCSKTELTDDNPDKGDLTIVGQWMLSSSSNNKSAKNSVVKDSINVVCNIHSIIFKEDKSFKLYTNDENDICNYVILGNYSINADNVITLSVQNTIVDSNGTSTKVTEEIGTIADLKFDGTSLSGSFKIEGLCVNLKEGYKESSYAEGLTYIPDENLEKWLVSEGWDNEIDGYVTTSIANNQPIVAIYATDNGYDSNGKWCQCYGDDRFSDRLTSLAGIEAFPNLQILRLVGNKLDSINISQNEKLKYLYLDFNTFKKLNTSNNNLLEEVALDNNEVIIEVDFRNNPNLKKLALPNIGIENLDISNNDKIEFLDIPNNKLNTINITNLTELNELRAGLNKLTTIDLSNNYKLISLELFGNNLAGTIDVSKITNLNIFKVLGNPNLTCIKVNESQLNALNGIDVPVGFKWEIDSFVTVSIDCN